MRVSTLFADDIGGIVEALGGTLGKRLGTEFYLIDLEDAAALTQADAARHVRWRMPLHHAWPCHPEAMDGFVEKAAQGLWRKFGQSRPQNVLVGVLDPTSPRRYYKLLASNLRGRALQVFGLTETAPKEAETQDAGRASLFCLIGKEGLFAGMCSPREAGAWHPGGTRFIRQSGEESVSRAGAKLAEALHVAALHRSLPAPGAAWLELGASPGGMTSELLRRGYHVTAVDRAALDARLDAAANLKFFREDVARFSPPPGLRFDALLCDMNGDAQNAMRQVARLSATLRPGALIVFTLKTTGAQGLAEVDELEHSVRASAERAGLELFHRTHLSYNRHEFTLCFTKPG